MCCEATDALLEYVRRHLGLTGLRNLNAPRRLKLRVPVLKEWLAKGGHTHLSRAIPDWDPVRRPTGRWKAWEVSYLKPIMDEKAVERQAKRMVMVGAGNANSHLQIMERAQASNVALTDQYAAVAGLTALQSAVGAVESSQASQVSHEGAMLAMPMDEGFRIVDDVGAARRTAAAGASVPATSAGEGIRQAQAHALSIQALLSRLEPDNDQQAAPVDAANLALSRLLSALEAPALGGCEWNGPSAADEAAYAKPFDTQEYSHSPPDEIPPDEMTSSQTTRAVEGLLGSQGVFELGSQDIVVLQAEASQPLLAPGVALSAQPTSLLPTRQTSHASATGDTAAIQTVKSEAIASGYDAASQDCMGDLISMSQCERMMGSQPGSQPI